MQKRNRIEIIKDMLEVIKNNKNKVLLTPLQRKSNLSSTRFQEYLSELRTKDFVEEEIEKDKKFIAITEKGFKFLEKYNVIKGFIEEFEL